MGERQKRDGQGREGWKKKSPDRTGAFTRGYEKQKVYQQGMKKQEEEEQKTKPARSVRNHSGKEKSLETQPDKAELTSRWEREKEKKMEKKNIEKEREMRETSGRPAVKKRRQNHIDWTKAYEKDALEDDVYYHY